MSITSRVTVRKQQTSLKEPSSLDSRLELEIHIDPDYPKGCEAENKSVGKEQAISATRQRCSGNLTQPGRSSTSRIHKV
ncbi:hypothetical protein AVEN_204632-1 [Araneus ventricosus]|uniref:Uncharacterized protein n=1 Tax=Araneus ventricosus TaxID=182803 RepID=A0A4Y2PK49_ARAVE|nr:hypothetical protein AVEN_204632-1 [Araneus ventricosus]